MPDETPFYEGLTTFIPRTDDSDDPNGGTYEKTGLKPNPRKHYSGRDVYHLAGGHVHGDASDFLGMATSDKYLPPYGAIQNPCFGDQNIFAELGLKGRVPPWPPKQVFRPGLRIGGELLAIDPGPAYYVVGRYELGGGVVNVAAPVAILKGGLALRGQAIAAVPVVAILKAGIGFKGEALDPLAAPIAARMAFGGGLLHVALPIELLSGLVGLGGNVDDVDLIPKSVSAEFKLRGVVADTTTVETKTGKLLFDGAVIDGPKLTETVYGLLGFKGNVAAIGPAAATIGGGLELGGAVVNVIQEISGGLALRGEALDDTPLPPTPGNSCDEAPVIEFDTDMTYDTPGSGFHWFKFPIDPMVTYYVKIVGNSGTLGNTTVATGNSCASTFDQFTLFGAGCSTFFIVIGSDTCFIKVAAPALGSGNYTLSAGVGSCP